MLPSFSFPQTQTSQTQTSSQTQNHLKPRHHPTASRCLLLMLSPTRGHLLPTNCRSWSRRVFSKARLLVEIARSAPVCSPPQTAILTALCQAHHQARRALLCVYEVSSIPHLPRISSCQQIKRASLHWSSWDSHKLPLRRSTRDGNPALIPSRTPTLSWSTPPVNLRIGTRGTCLTPTS